MPPYKKIGTSSDDLDALMPNAPPGDVPVSGNIITEADEYDRIDRDLD